MCFRPTSVDAGTKCPNCNTELAIPPGVEMKECPICGAALPAMGDLGAPVAPGAPTAPVAGTPQPPSVPGAPSTPKSPGV